MTTAVASPDFVTIATNVGVFLATVGAVVAAIWKTVKAIKVAGPEATTATKIVGGTILDNASIILWSESNRNVVDEVKALTREVVELRFAVTALKDEMK
jgi:hypothetical protein